MPNIFPLRINALYLESPEQVIGQDIRFENVPWMNTERDVFENPNVPLETNSIIPRPFSWDNGIYLDEGVHLHFVLPAYFKKFDDRGNLPKAPNRWYIKRQRDAKEWIIESDYIWNVNDPKLNKNTTCTYIQEGQDQFSFIYTGRKYRLEDWLHTSNTRDQYLKNLTALGWGSFSFDIHYPNCRSMFGFYDEEGVEEDAYTVMGWVEDPGNAVTGEYIVAGKFQLRPETTVENDESFDIAIANTLPETLSALIINANNPDLSKLDLQKQEEQMASMIHFDELKDLNLDWISRLRHKQHEQQFHKTSGTTKYILNIVHGDDEDFIKEYDFDINLLDFEFSKEVDNLYRNIQETLNNLDQSELSGEAILAIWNGISFPELTRISYNESLEEELEAINRIMNNGELDTFRLHAKIESLYLHWSTYLSALFLTKDKNINKVKDDLRLLISQIHILKEKLKKNERRVANLQVSFERKISGYYIKYCDYAIIRFLMKAKNAGDVIDREEFKTLLDQRYKTKIALSKKSRTDYFSALPPSIIISSAKKNTVFNLFTNPSELPESKPDLLFDSKQKDTYKNILNEISDFQEINVNVWHTYKVEWESSFLPKKEGHYLAADKKFSENFLRDSYILDELNADLIKEYRLNDLSYMPNPNTYYGQSFVSNTVQEYVKEKLEKNLNRIDEAENAQLIGQMKGFLHKLEDTSLFELTLSDFNNLMLQRSNGLSVLPLIPNGFEDHKEIANNIESLCREYFNSLNLLTPNRLSIFNPFRNGAFKIGRLRIIDSFGRDQLIKPEKILTTHVQKIENKDQWVMLPPRYLQSAALSTRFTGTLTDKKKSPVLGWMVPVYLNQRIEFFDAHGKHLGAIDTEGQWESSPFDADLAQANTGYRSVVKNSHLKRIIHWMIERICKSDKKDLFIKELQKTMEHTSPEDTANPSLLETISSVPIAITLVNINLFTKGEALYDINYSKNISINTYDNQRKYDKVKIPMSIGDLNQYNDGVLAYWHYNLKDEDRESDDRLGLKYLESKIYFNNDVHKKIENQSYSLKDFLKENPIDGREKWNALESKALISSSINYKSQDKESHLALNETLNACQRYVLMHPKGNLNVKTGILPEKSIRLPYHRIKNALKRIELTLLTAPVLTPKENLQLSLVKDSRYEWSWIELGKKTKKQPLSTENPPLKNRITQNLAIDFNKNPGTESDVQALLTDLESDGLLVNELSAFFPGEKMYFIKKDEFERQNETVRDAIRSGFINDAVTGRIFKEERVKSQKVAFDFNNFKTKRYTALKEFLIKEGYVIPSETNLLNSEVFFINFSKINELQSKNESALDDSEKEVMSLLALKTSNKIIDLKQLSGKLYAFRTGNASLLISEGFKRSLMNKKIIHQDAFYPDEQIYFINVGELEKVKLKEQPDEYEKMLLKMVDEKSNAILQITDFNTNSGAIPKLVLKEGWLSIKSTKF
ncbi:hypothetical protein MKJ01_17570 [Chryseobacterium sp. SSA4.19]|uniref:hypothetical protein n=1 Tax=Chryseobacterium sp. SSA4.19 TaxID=2919915 RepID=UPI001F4E0E27|nr:hypothetical protein [Chryseobacterium sp. SSA4.19]MCJ8155569.1 hypothetical protein [Chryseobacterium sp. SSA4.19]